MTRRTLSEEILLRCLREEGEVVACGTIEIRAAERLEREGLARITDERGYTINGSLTSVRLEAT